MHTIKKVVSYNYVTISVQAYVRFIELSNRIKKSINQRELDRIDFSPGSDCFSVQLLNRKVTKQQKLTGGWELI